VNASARRFEDDLRFALANGAPKGGCLEIRSFRQAEKTAIMRPNSGFIRGIPVEAVPVIASVAVLGKQKSPVSRLFWQQNAGCG
jgi:hypothetical protein